MVGDYGTKWCGVGDVRSDYGTKVWDRSDFGTDVRARGEYRAKIGEW